MGYNTLPQSDHDEVAEADGHDGHGPGNADLRNSPLGRPVSPPRGRLFLGAHENTRHELLPSTTSTGNNNVGNNGIGGLVQLIAGNTHKRYDMIESDDYEDYNDDLTAEASASPPLFIQPTKAIAAKTSNKTFVRQPVPLPPPPATALREALKPSSSTEDTPILRTASGHSIALRHPTPDLQTLQGAYLGNIEHLERTAERLSMTSSIEDAIRDLHEELKRSDSRRSSLLESQGLALMSRQASNASSIVEVNSAARSGGYSPAAFVMSPPGSFTTGSGRGRSASRSSRFASRPEPELEGRPLDSFVSHTLPASPLLQRAFSIPELAPLSRTDSIPEQDEESAALAQPILPTIETPIMFMDEPESYAGPDRPETSASHNTLEQTRAMFADFDGVHVEPQEARKVSPFDSNTSEHTQRPRRRSSGNMLAANERPKSYADPLTGQQMVYYPAPVPMMLNLPQKLSKNSSSTAKNKRRTQALSTIPPAARKSAVWLPDVLETNDHELAETDPAQQQEYIPQHQRAIMGGRRNTQDISQMPPQLRANNFFDLPATSQVVELKEQSAMATLDSILDASAFAPVNAFTDHAFAGRLGAEVYGREHGRNKNSSPNLLNVPKKRSSTFGLFVNGRGSRSDLLEADNEKRRSTMAGVVEGTKRKPIDDDDEDDENVEGGDHDEDDEGQEEFYEGAPTTLLAELQIRKQQQKQRTRPLTTAFPNGVHSTLLQLDAVAQVEKKTRQNRRVNLAWEDPSFRQEAEEAIEEDEDIPLGLLYAKNYEDRNRPIGLMERRELEDNEPLSRRRERLLGHAPQPNRASTMMNLSGPGMAHDDEEEPLAYRIQRLKDEHAADLPSARPVSGDFASEMMSQFGGPDAKMQTDTPQPSEEEETLGQRRKRLQAEREARELEVGKTGELLERPAIKTKRSMADILRAHPAAGGADRVASYQKPATGLLGLHEQNSAKRASTMIGLSTQAQRAKPQMPTQVPRNTSYQANNIFGNINTPPPFAQPTMMGGYNNNGMGGYNNGMGVYNNGMAMGGYGQPMMMPFANPYAMNMASYMNTMQASMGMRMEPLNQGQIDMVESWRQSVMTQQQQQ